MELTEPVKALLREAARALTGSERRRFLARTVEELGPGGQRRAERELGWSRATIRNVQRELTSGVACVDGFALRGRKRAEAHLPALLDDLEAVVVGQSQADPSFRTTRLYPRLTAAEVRRQLIARYSYADVQLPCLQTIGAKLNALGYHPQTVAKTPPPHRSPRPPPSSPPCPPSLRPPPLPLLLPSFLLSLLLLFLLSLLSFFFLLLFPFLFFFSPLFPLLPPLLPS
ncbi:MAG: hypothetical protein ACR2J4_04885, partial [Deinococcus sp.]